MFIILTIGELKAKPRRPISLQIYKKMGIREDESPQTITMAGYTIMMAIGK